MNRTAESYRDCLLTGRLNARILTFFLLLCLQACSIPACAQIKIKAQGTTAPAHDQWDALLRKWVDADGMVDYKGFLQDRKALQAYLKTLEAHPPDEKNWSREEQLAYWINAYNAYTIALVLRHYPLESIKDIKPGLQIPFLVSPWDIRFINIGGTELDLNNIEHSIIRPGFKEPRIHFALVCAARSCPKLRREAYVANKLDTQLAEQARSFLLDPDKNSVSTHQLELSKIFDWYQGDFTEGGSLQEAISELSGVPVAPEAAIRYRHYSWELNEQEEPADK